MLLEGARAYLAWIFPYLRSCCEWPPVWNISDPGPFDFESLFV